MRLKGSDDFVKVSVYTLNSVHLSYRYKEDRIFTDVSDSHSFYKSINGLKIIELLTDISIWRLWADEALTVGRFFSFFRKLYKYKN